MLLLSTFMGKEVFAPPNCARCTKTLWFSFLFFFFFSLQLLNLILHSSQFLEYLSTFGVAKKQFFKKVIIFVYKMISNIVFFLILHHLDFEIYKEDIWSKETKLKGKLFLKRGNKNVKKPKLLKNLAFLLYAPKNIKICPMQYGREHTDVVVLYLKILRDTLRQNLKDTK